MAPNTVRYTATLPRDYVDKLKVLANEKKIPSVNFAINEAVDIYLKNKKAKQYDESMKEAAKDEAFIARTMICAEDFSTVDSEVSGKW